jgi:hypothetical protein
MACPQINHFLIVLINADGGAYFALLVEVIGKCGLDGRKFGVTKTVYYYVWHRSHAEGKSGHPELFWDCGHSPSLWRQLMNNG